MEGNKDDSLKCIQLAEKCIKTGNFEQATKYLNKAERLYPTQKAKDLLSHVEKMQTQSSECGADNERQGRDPTPERRRHNSHGECQDLQPKYTQEQLEAVKKIRKCKDYYEILGLPKECCDDDLKKAYRKLALKFHPDKNHAPGAAEAFKAIGNAFSVLSDPARRQRYDEYGIEDSSSHRSRRHGYDNDYTRGFEGDVSAEELFRMFFGGGQPTFMSHNSRARRQASAGSNNHARDRNESPYTFLLQLSPLILLIMLSLLSSLMVGQPQYSLRRDLKYSVERKTANLGVSYYVRSDFAAGKDKSELRSIERQVEDDYLTELQHMCYRERQNKETALWRAQMYGNAELYKQASNMKLQNCDRLRQLNGA